MKDVSAVTARMELRVYKRIKRLKQKKKEEYIFCRISNMETGQAGRLHDIGVHIHADVSVATLFQMPSLW